MNYIRTTDGLYPATPRQLHPAVSFAEGWCGGMVEGAEYVCVSAVPEPDQDPCRGCLHMECNDTATTPAAVIAFFFKIIALCHLSVQSNMGATLKRHMLDPYPVP
jgi:hypothetical protein